MSSKWMRLKIKKFCIHFMWNTFCKCGCNLFRMWGKWECFWYVSLYTCTLVSIHTQTGNTTCLVLFQVDTRIRIRNVQVRWGWDKIDLYYWTIAMFSAYRFDRNTRTAWYSDSLSLENHHKLVKPSEHVSV